MGEGESSRNPIALADEENKDNSPHTTPVSDCPVGTLRLLKVRPSGRWVEDVPEIDYRTLFEEILKVRVCNTVYIYSKCFINNTIFSTLVKHVRKGGSLVFVTILLAVIFAYIESKLRQECASRVKTTKKSS